MKKSFLYALKHSFPIFFGFFPVGISYGLSMYNAGYNILETLFCCVCVLAGSYQFVMIGLVAESASYLTILFTALVVNSRHMFYGLSFIEKFRSFGKVKYFLIYALPDETYSLDCSHNFGADVNEKLAYIFTAMLVPAYWFICVCIGCLAGSIVPFDITGVDFALTALFVVVVVDQLRTATTKIPFYIAIASCLVSILIFGSANFIFPALVLIVVGLVLLRGRIENVA